MGNGRWPRVTQVPLTLKVSGTFRWKSAFRIVEWGETAVLMTTN